LDVPGICAESSQGITDTCSNTSFCVNNLTCLNTEGSGCDDGLRCTCEFPYPNPNNPDPGISCIKGMVNVSGVCYNDKGLGCSQGLGRCYASNMCGSPPILATYKFSDSTNHLNFMSATSTTILGIKGPPTALNPHKLFTHS